MCALSGCAATPEPAPPTSAPSPTETFTPVFANNDEALAAATAAYAAYQEMNDVILQAGGQQPERIEPYVAAERLPVEIQEFQDFQNIQAHTVGASAFVITQLQSARYQTVEQTDIVVYLCDDLSEVDMVDPAGMSLLAGDTSRRTPFEVRFKFEGGVLVLYGRDFWNGGGVC
ncbi:hypothetical protein D6T64_00850 [Cryobacterium melibiosiphilum]|uniref:Uncharacterized protein n=1 Tax=Cryobacterium melibiosiphilum TaxID=995039 RepID=A0A3A5N175_9MICO|nr:hypothetical protein D6T64_00850 [Cryobacterium melibiosiphilum]